MKTTHETSSPEQTVESPSKPSPRKRSSEEILEMRKRGMTMPEIAAVCGCTKQNIAGILKHQGSRMSKVDRFRADKSVILEEKQRMLLSALDDKKIAAMSGKDLTISAAVLIDKQRLIDGHSASGGSISLLVIANKIHAEYQSGSLKGGESVVLAEMEVVSPPPSHVVNDLREVREGAPEGRGIHSQTQPRATLVRPTDRPTTESLSQHLHQVSFRDRSHAAVSSGDPSSPARNLSPSSYSSGCCFDVFWRTISAPLAVLMVIRGTLLYE